MGRKTARRRSEFRVVKEVKKLARERIGSVKAGQIIEPKGRRKPLKHPKRDKENWLEA